MNIEERIKEVDLRPSDIVKLQVLAEGKPISLSQATGWIKNPTATKAIEQLLWRLCDEKVESGLTFSKPGRKKESVSAEIFRTPEESDILASTVVFAPTQEKAKKWLREFELPSGAPGIGVDVSKPFHSTDSVLNTVGKQKIPASEHLLSATPTGFASWGTNGTMKIAGKMVKFNMNDLSYTIDFEKAKSGFLVDGKKYLLPDFKEV